MGHRRDTEIKIERDAWEIEALLGGWISECARRRYSDDVPAAEHVEARLRELRTELLRIGATELPAILTATPDDPAEIEEIQRRAMGRLGTPDRLREVRAELGQIATTED